ncbi:MAG: hypothetical protein Q4C48_06760 [Lachnospiraceae bacterium]|nr:hypothetical protein [Lachnospiraceae bacterium]
MIEGKEMEVLLLQKKKSEAEEIMNFVSSLDPYEKREFLGYIRGAKMVKQINWVHKY